MAEPFLSEIRIMSFGFAPKGWALCNGQLLAHQPEPGAVLAARHDLRRRRPGELRAARPRGPRRRSTSGAATRWASAAASRRTRCRSPSCRRTRTSLQRHRRRRRTTVHAGQPASCWSQSTGDARLRPRRQPRRPWRQQTIEQRRRLARRTSNMQPFLTLSFCIALQGIFPSARPEEADRWHNPTSARSGCSPATSPRPAGCSARDSSCRSPRTRRCSS